MLNKNKIKYFLALFKTNLHKKPPKVQLSGGFKLNYSLKAKRILALLQNLA